MTHGTGFPPPHPVEGQRPRVMCECGVLRVAPAHEHAAPTAAVHSCPHHAFETCSVCVKVTATLWRELCATMNVLPYTVEPVRSLPPRDLLG